MPGQHSRADPEGVGVGNLTLRTGKQENWSCLLLTSARGEFITLQLSRPRMEGYELAHPIIYPI